MQYASFTLRSLWLSQLNSASQAFWYLHKYFFRLAGEEQAGPDKDHSENTGILPIERTTIRMVNYNQQQYTFEVSN
jgi:hypothetical protein